MPDPATVVTDPAAGPAAPVEPVADPVAPPAPPAPVAPPADPAAPAYVAPPAEPAPAAVPPAAPERIVPEADGYVMPAGTPEGLGAFANANGFTQEQLDSSMGFFAALQNSEGEAGAADLRAQGEQQMADWGENADRNLNLAKQALSKNDPDGTLTAVLNESGFGNHPAVMQFLLSLGETMREGGYIKSSVNTPAGVRTAAQTLYPNMNTRN